jgi:hypothetical protein
MALPQRLKMGDERWPPALRALASSQAAPDGDLLAAAGCYDHVTWMQGCDRYQVSNGGSHDTALFAGHQSSANGGSHITAAPFAGHQSSANGGSHITAAPFAGHQSSANGGSHSIAALLAAGSAWRELLEQGGSLLTALDSTTKQASAATMQACLVYSDALALFRKLLDDFCVRQPPCAADEKSRSKDDATTFNENLRTECLQFKPACTLYQKTVHLWTTSNRRDFFRSKLQDSNSRDALNAAKLIAIHISTRAYQKKLQDELTLNFQSGAHHQGHPCCQLACPNASLLPAERLPA